MNLAGFMEKVTAKLGSLAGKTLNKVFGESRFKQLLKTGKGIIKACSIDFLLTTGVITDVVTQAIDGASALLGYYKETADKAKVVIKRKIDVPRLTGVTFGNLAFVSETLETVCGKVLVRFNLDGHELEVLLPIPNKNGFFDWDGTIYHSKKLLWADKRLLNIYEQFFLNLLRGINLGDTAGKKEWYWKAKIDEARKTTINGKHGSIVPCCTEFISNDEVGVELSDFAKFCRGKMVVIGYLAVIEAGGGLSEDFLTVAQSIAVQISWANNIKGIDILTVKQDTSMFQVGLLAVNYADKDGVLTKVRHISDIGDYVSDFGVRQAFGDGTRYSPGAIRSGKLANEQYKSVTLNLEHNSAPGMDTVTAYGLCLQTAHIPLYLEVTGGNKVSKIDNSLEQYFISRDLVKMTRILGDKARGSIKISTNAKGKGMTDTYCNKIYAMIGGTKQKIHILLPKKENGLSAKWLKYTLMQLWTEKTKGALITFAEQLKGVAHWLAKVPEYENQVDFWVEDMQGKKIFEGKTSYVYLPVFQEPGRDSAANATFGTFRVAYSYAIEAARFLGTKVFDSLLKDFDKPAYLGSIHGAGFDIVEDLVGKKVLTKPIVFKRARAIELGANFGQIENEVDFFSDSRSVWSNADSKMAASWLFYAEEWNKATSASGWDMLTEDQRKEELKYLSCDLVPSFVGKTRLVKMGEALVALLNAGTIPEGIDSLVGAELEEFIAKMHSIRWVSVGKCLVACSPKVMGKNRISPEICLAIKLGIKVQEILAHQSSEVAELISADIAKFLAATAEDDYIAYLLEKLLADPQKKYNEDLVKDFATLASLNSNLRSMHVSPLQNANNYFNSGLSCYRTAMAHNSCQTEIWLDEATVNRIKKEQSWEPGKKLFGFALKQPVTNVLGILFEISTTNFARKGEVRIHPAAYAIFSGADFDGDGLSISFQIRDWMHNFKAVSYLSEVKIDNYGFDIVKAMESEKVRAYAADLTEKSVMEMRMLGMFLLVALKEYTGTTTYAASLILKAINESGIEVSSFEEAQEVVKELGLGIQNALDLKHIAYKLLNTGGDITADTIATAIAKEPAIVLLDSSNKVRNISKVLLNEKTTKNLMD